MLMGCGVVYLASVRQWKEQIFNSGDICVFFLPLPASWPIW